MARDLYEVLGVDRGASKDAIRKAYRSKAMELHPDRNKDAGAEDRFKEVQRAYGVLSDDNKRASYDQFGEAALNGAGQQGFDGAGFQDIFSTLFGDSRGFGGFGFDSPFGGEQGFKERGRDLQAKVTLDLEEAIRGSNRKLRITGMLMCDDCSGSGMGKDSRQVNCEQCGGSGMVRNNIGGVFSMQATCRKCGGSGKKIENPCGKCGGTGKARKTREESVDIPPGIDNGDVLRVPGKGDAAPGGAPGDLRVAVEVKEHEIFKRDGEDLYCELPIMFTTAVLGGPVKIPTVDGPVNYHLPKGIQNGKSLRLRGKGVKGVRTGRTGDLYAVINIETPTNLSREQAKLVEQLDRTLQKNPEKHTPNREGWVKRAKRFFS